MKPFLKTLVLFILLTIPAYAIITYLVEKSFPKKYAYLTNISYRPASYGHLQTRISDIPNYPKVDYLVIGSSHAYRGFDPRIFKEFGHTMFNLGSSAQSPLQSRYLLSKYIDQLNPDTVIIETFPGAFTFDGVESSTDVISNDNLSPDLLCLALSHSNIRPINTFFARFIDKDILGKTYNEPTYSRNSTYISGGFVAIDQGFYKETTQGNEGNANTPPSKRSGQIEDIVRTLTYREDQLDAFREMLDLLKQKDIPYILVQAPVSRGFYKSMGDIAPFDSLMNTAGPYTNYNTILSLPDTNFFDLDHLNQYGVEVFDRKLLEDI